MFGKVNISLSLYDIDDILDEHNESVNLDATGNHLDGKHDKERS